MGVSIDAFKVQWIPDHTVTRECWNEGEHQTSYVYNEHIRSFDGIPVVPPFEGAPAGITFGPCYVWTPDSFEIMQRGYSGYNRWREGFSASVQGRTPQEVWEDRTGPAVDLIHFADNEGCIGPEAAARLLVVFEDPAMRDKYIASNPPGLLFQEAADQVWDRWTEGLRIAAGGGMVNFG